MLLALAAALAGCGGASGTNQGSLASTCTRERAALERIGPVVTLADASRALRALVALERRALADLSAGGVGAGALETRVRLALASSRRSLAALESADRRDTMDPIRTGAPAARRAAAIAEGLLGDLCRRANA